MIWQCTEILAVVVECMIVTRMLIQYFKFRSENCRILKWILLFSLLFATDVAGTFRGSKRNIFDFQLSVN